MTNPQLFVGPMSKNVVDACIEYVNEENVSIGLIPSRRQVDMNSGYVNGWTTDTLASYVRSLTNRVILQRDHGGGLQGDREDDGMESLKFDSMHFDLLHIDPFKQCKSIEDAAIYTASAINLISELSECGYEIGTEEAIFPMSVEDAFSFFSRVQNETGSNFDRVQYLVVQFGTKIIGTRNTGKFDINRANEMISMCRDFGKMSKEHNGDYLSVEGVRERRSLGLDALNIAPEMGGIETDCILEWMDNNRRNLIDTFFGCCIATNRWQKWFVKNFDPNSNKVDVLRACGHYCFSTPTFAKLMESIDYKSISNEARRRMKKRIKELL